MFPSGGHLHTGALAVVLMMTGAATTVGALREARPWPLALASLSWSALGLTAYLTVR
jgi:hypothetical protein